MNRDSENFAAQIKRCFDSHGRITKALTLSATPHTVNSVTMERGHSPLCVALRKNLHAVAKLLCERGANVNFARTVDENGHKGASPLWYLMMTRFGSAHEDERLELFRFMLDNMCVHERSVFLSQKLVGNFPPLLATPNQKFLQLLLEREWVVEHALAHINAATGNNILMDCVSVKNKPALARCRS